MKGAAYFVVSICVLLVISAFLLYNPCKQELKMLTGEKYLGYVTPYTLDNYLVCKGEILRED